MSPAATPADLAAAAKGARLKAGESQLASFSLFEAKDPFVQKIVEKAETEAKAGCGTERRRRRAAGAAAGGDHGRRPGTHPGSRLRVRDHLGQRRA